MGSEMTNLNQKYNQTGGHRTGKEVIRTYPGEIIIN